MSDWLEMTEFTRVVTEEHGFQVDFNGVTKIEVFSVRGELSYVPWFRVHHKDGHLTEVNGKHVVLVERPGGEE